MLNPSGEGPEIVALALIERIARAEGRQFEHKLEAGASIADREWILTTYFDCLQAVKGHRFGPSEKAPQL